MSALAPVATQSRPNCGYLPGTVISIRGGNVDLGTTRQDDWDGACDQERRSHAAGRPFLRLGLERHHLWIGPLSRPDSIGCTECFSRQLRRNHPHADIFKDIFNDLADFDASSTWHPSLRVLLPSLCEHVCLEERAVWRFDALSLESRRHRLSPADECVRCHGAPLKRLRQQRAPTEKRRPNDYRTGILDITHREALADLIDFRLGAVSHVYHDLQSDLVPMWGAEAKLLGTAEVEQGFGRTNSTNLARNVAVLEIMERRCGHVPGHRATVTSSYEDLGEEKALDPQALVLHQPQQRDEPGYRLSPYRSTDVIRWTDAHSLGQNRGILIPEQMAFYDATRNGSEPRFVQETSNGSALGASLPEATFFALLEIIERDAYLNHWLLRAAPVPIDLATAGNSDVRVLAARAQAKKYDIRAFDLRLDVDVPTVMVMMCDMTGAAPVASYCASGTHPDPNKAALAAMVEVLTSVAVYARSMPTEQTRVAELLDDHSRVQSMHDHVLMYSHARALPLLAHYLTAEQPRSFAEVYAAPNRFDAGDIRDDLALLVSDLIRSAGDVIVVDQSTTVTLSKGLYAVKAFVPGYSPMTFGHQYRRLAFPRIEVVRDLLHARGRSTVSGVNPTPHNFP